MNCMKDLPYIVFLIMYAAMAGALAYWAASARHWRKRCQRAESLLTGQAHVRS